MVVFALVRFGQRPPPPPLTRMSMLLPEKSRALSLAVSPDGRSVAVVLVTGGKQQIWIRTLDSFQLTPLAGTVGGADPFWSPDWTMMAVSVNTSPVFQAGTPQPVFDTQMVDTGIRTGPMSWDIAPDGKRFLIISDESRDTSSLNVILNWQRAAPLGLF